MRNLGAREKVWRDAGRTFVEEASKDEEAVPRLAARDLTDMIRESCRNSTDLFTFLVCLRWGKDIIPRNISYLEQVEAIQVKIEQELRADNRGFLSKLETVADPRLFGSLRTNLSAWIDGMKPEGAAPSADGASRPPNKPDETRQRHRLPEAARSQAGNVQGWTL